MIAVASSVEATERPFRARRSALQPSIAAQLQCVFHAAASGDPSARSLARALQARRRFEYLQRHCGVSARKPLAQRALHARSQHRTLHRHRSRGTHGPQHNPTTLITVPGGHAGGSASQAAVLWSQLYPEQHVTGAAAPVLSTHAPFAFNRAPAQLTPASTTPSHAPACRVGRFAMHARYVTPSHEQNVSGRAHGGTSMHSPSPPQLDVENTHSCPSAHSAPDRHEIVGVPASMHARSVHARFPSARHEHSLQPSPAGQVCPTGQNSPLRSLHPALASPPIASRPPSLCGETALPHASRNTNANTKAAPRFFRTLMDVSPSKGPSPSRSSAKVAHKDPTNGALQPR
jgi:hypothetical protein